MKYLDELEVISKLRMFYKGDVFDKMSGTEVDSAVSTSQKQSYLYGKIFNDESIINSASTIVQILQSDEKLTDASLSDIISLLTSVTETSEPSPLFEISVHKLELAGPETTNSSFGDISWKIAGVSQVNYLDSLFQGEMTVPENKSIMLVKVKNREVHPAYHATEASEVFLNYIPVLERSRCAPIFSVDVFTRTTLPQEAALLTGGASVITEGAEIFSGSLDKQIPNLSALKFLNGDNAIERDRYNTADGLLTMASTRLHSGTSIQEMQSGASGSQVPVRYAVPDSTELTGDIKPNTITNPYVMQTNGMEMFTMPQSLISKTSGALEIDPFRPLMSIKSATITTQSAGQGIIAWNTAELVIDVYDRHRLNDIAFFLDPGKYAFTKFQLTAGWKHQDSSSPYGKYIERMVSKELYSLKSSSYSFNDAGVVTVNLSLAMSGAREISNSSMFAAGAEGQGIRDAYEDLTNDLQTIRAGTSAINSKRTTGNLLPTSVITQQNSSSAMILDTQAMTRVRSASTGDMSSDDRDEFRLAIARLGAGALVDYYNMLETYVDKFLEEAGLPPGSTEPIIESPAGDPYEYKYTSENEWFTRNKETAAPDAWVKPTGTNLASIVASFPNVPARMTSINSGETVRFDKLLLNALIKRMLQGAESAADEIHIFMYEFNDKCPALRNTYMGDFEVNVSKITEKLKKVIKETQNLTVSSFVNVIKSEMKDKLNPQFGIVTIAQLETISATRVKITEQETLIANQTARRVTETEKIEAETNVDRKQLIQKDIDKIDVLINGYNEEISRLQDVINDLLTNGESAQGRSQRTSSIDMPELKIKLESKKSSDNKNILRVHVYDGKSKPNELSTFLANLNNAPSLEYIVKSAENPVPNPDGSIPPAVVTAADNAKKALMKAGLAYERKITDRFGVEKTRLVVNTQSHTLKKTIKNIMPSITYGVEGTAINKASMNSVPDANIQAHFLLQSQNENTPNTSNSQTGESEQDAQKIMPVNISLDMMGCPLLRYGQEYFVDFDTNTDLDNVYAMTKITHNISPGVFKTTAQLKPTFKGSVSFGSFLSDIELMSDPPATTETPPVVQATTTE